MFRAFRKFATFAMFPKFPMFAVFAIFPMFAMFAMFPMFAMFAMFPMFMLVVAAGCKLVRGGLSLSIRPRSIMCLASTVPPPTPQAFA
jgi:hypothetical protein